MMSTVFIIYNEGHADIEIGGRVMTIGRSDNDAGKYLCPTDLVSAALGS